jgi:sarcosine oxidase subunit alpha
MNTLPSASARTPLSLWHAAHRARFAESDGWQVPESYAPLEREVDAARNGLALVDLSAWTKISLLGREVADLTHALAADGLAGKTRGVSRLDGTTLAVACRLTADQLLLLMETTNAGPLEQRLAEIGKEPRIVMRDATSAYAYFSLLGSRAREVLARQTSLDVSLSALPAGSCAETGMAGVPTLLVCPPAMPLPVLSICVAWDLGEYLWESLLEAGRREGIAPIGLEAWRRALTP